MFLFYLTASCTVLIYSLYYYFTRTFNFWKERNVKGPTPVAFFGNLKDSTLRRKVIAEAIQEAYNQFPNEKVVGVYRMTTPCLVLKDLDIIKHVFIKDFDQFIDRGIEFSKEGLGANLFHADGDTWQVLRNRFTPIFTSGKLKNMFYLLNERGDKFIEYVEKTCKVQPEQNVYLLLQKYMLSTISACAFGIDIDPLKDKMEPLHVLDKTMLQTSFFFELDMMYPGLFKKLNTSLFPKSVSDFFNDLVKTVFVNRNGKPSNRKDFMDLILEIRQHKELQGNKRQNHETLTLELTEGVIAAQAFVFFVAGYETSTSTLSFMFYLLAKHPEIQDKLLAEIDEVLQRHNGELSYDLLSEMTYLTKVLDETLRVFPVVDPLQRCATKDYKIPGTDLTIKKGQMVLVSVLGIHHDEKYYPDPEKFDPERFNVENTGNRHSCAYLPFGTGPRNCIGMRFAKVQSMACTIKLLSKFRVEPTANTKMDLKFDPHRLVINPLGGIPLSFVPRKA